MTITERLRRPAHLRRQPDDLDPAHVFDEDEHVDSLPFPPSAHEGLALPWILAPGGSAYFRSSVDVDLEALADQLLVVFEGAFVVARTLGEPDVMAAQLRQYRTYLELLFSPQSIASDAY